MTEPRAMTAYSTERLQALCRAAALVLPLMDPEATGAALERMRIELARRGYDEYGPLPAAPVPPPQREQTPPRKALGRVGRLTATSALVVAAVGAVAFATTKAGGGEQSEPAGKAAISPAPAETRNVCDVLSAAFVGGAVHKPMSAHKLAVGTGCRYAGRPGKVDVKRPGKVDVKTAYPPDISAVQVIYTAPSGTLSAAGVRRLFEDRRAETTGATDIPGAGEAAFGQGARVTVLDRGMMISVSTSGTVRTASIPEVQRWLVTVAEELRTKLS